MHLRMIIYEEMKEEFDQLIHVEVDHEMEESTKWTIRYNYDERDTIVWVDGDDFSFTGRLGGGFITPSKFFDWTTPDPQRICN